MIQLFFYYKWSILKYIRIRVGFVQSAGIEVSHKWLFDLTHFSSIKKVFDVEFRRQTLFYILILNPFGSFLCLTCALCIYGSRWFLRWNSHESEFLMTCRTWKVPCWLFHLFSNSVAVAAFLWWHCMSFSTSWEGFDWNSIFPSTNNILSYTEYTPSFW